MGRVTFSLFTSTLIPPAANLLFSFGERWTLPGRFSVRAVAPVSSFGSPQPEVWGPSPVGTGVLPEARCLSRCSGASEPRARTACAGRLREGTAAPGPGGAVLPL